VGDEKWMFLSLLADLCAGIEQPEGASTGRPRLPLSDVVFGIVYKAYARCSARRFTTDIRTAQDAGLVERVPSFNALLNYQRDPATGSVLTDLVQLSALPLRTIEAATAKIPAEQSNEELATAVADNLCVLIQRNLVDVLTAATSERAQQVRNGVRNRRVAIYRQMEDEREAREAAARTRREAREAAARTRREAREAAARTRREAREASNYERRVRAAFQMPTGIRLDNTSFGGVAPAEKWHAGTSDPVFDEVSEMPLTRAETWALGKQASIVPANFMTRCEEGELQLIIDDTGPRFLSAVRSRREAVPWKDAPGPIPSMALNSVGHMAHKGGARKQKQKLARGGGRRPSGKAKSAA